MKDQQLREAESFARIKEFGAGVAAAFPPASLGGQKFAAIGSVVNDLRAQGSAQSLGHGAAKTSTGAKKAARESLRQQLRAISKTARSMNSISPELGATFRLPKNNGDGALLNTARAVLEAATPLKAEFLKREMPESFLDDLAATINTFEAADTSKNTNREKRVGATAFLKQALERGRALKQELDAIVRNKFRNDPAKLAAWKTATHVERPPSRKKTGGEQ